MKAITLWQPWASLIALGVKTIETRSWRPPAGLIGERIAIHAATKPLPIGGVALGGWLAINAITDPAYKGPQPCNPVTGRQRHIPRRAQTPKLMWPHSGPHQRLREDAPQYSHTEPLPLGAVVATARLVEVLPMLDVARPRVEGPCLVEVNGTLRIYHEWTAVEGNWTSVEDQRPYGDFAPSRWAWMLDDIQPLSLPQRARGGQRIWNWLEVEQEATR